MSAYERLRHLADDERLLDRVNACFQSIRQYGVHPIRALSIMADDLCALHGLSAEVHNNAVVFYHSASRAKQPACMVVSMASNSPSPSAGLIVSTATALIQVFEGDADDTDLAGAGPYTARWIETKGRLLLH